MAHYAVNPNKVYVCGFSMGGFMTERMACESNNKIAAFASVAGTIGSGIASCNPGRTVPIAHFHGTADQTVGYYANNYGITADSLIHFWIANNHCDTTAAHTVFPNTVNDGFTVEQFSYADGVQKPTVELIRVNGAGHTWLYQPVNDISYVIEIWKFFSQFKTPVSNNDIDAPKDLNIAVFPNPAKDNITISLPKTEQHTSFNLCIYNMLGEKVFEDNTAASSYMLSLAKGFDNGIYVLHVSTNNGSFSQKLIIAK